jgi:hypothetical protein
LASGSDLVSIVHTWPVLGLAGTECFCVSQIPVGGIQDGGGTQPSTRNEPYSSLIVTVIAVPSRHSTLLLSGRQDAKMVPSYGCLQHVHLRKANHTVIEWIEVANHPIPFFAFRIFVIYAVTFTILASAASKKSKSNW